MEEYYLTETTIEWAQCSVPDSEPEDDEEEDTSMPVNIYCHAADPVAGVRALGYLGRVRVAR